MATAIPGGPTQVGVLDQSTPGGSTLAGGALEIHTVDAVPISVTSGLPVLDQVVELSREGGVQDIVHLLQSIDARMAQIEEHLLGFATTNT